MFGRQVAERSRQLTLPRLAVGLLLVSLFGYVYGTAVPTTSGSGGSSTVAAGTSAPTAIAPSTTPLPSPPATGRTGASDGSAAATVPEPPPWRPGLAFLGITIEDATGAAAAVAAFESTTRYSPRVVQFTRAWAGDVFDPTPFRELAGAGAMPVLSWEPWNPLLQTRRARELGDQPAYRLDRIARGDFDTYIASYGRGIRDLGFPVAVRFGHEMNGFWYPWGESANGNQPGDYARAYLHVQEVFGAVGADNALWVWSPNLAYPGSSSLDPLYPGDAHVDWIGVSGYYGTPRLGYVSFEDLFSFTLTSLRTLSDRPLVITEVAASDEHGEKARWVTEMFEALPRHPDIIGVLWFELSKEIDWRIAASPGAVRAFTQGAGDKRYAQRWQPG